MTITELINSLKDINRDFTVHAYEGERCGIRIDDENGDEVDFIETD